MIYKCIPFLLILIWSPILCAMDGEDTRPVFLDEENKIFSTKLYGEFLECLRTGKFSSDYGPREVDTRNKRLVVTRINNNLWAIEVREYMDKVIIKNIVINTRNIYTMKEIRRYILYLVRHC